jgi:hypothetical protein
MNVFGNEDLYMYGYRGRKWEEVTNMVETTV